MRSTKDKLLVIAGLDPAIHVQDIQLRNVKA